MVLWVFSREECFVLLLHGLWSDPITTAATLDNAADAVLPAKHTAAHLLLTGKDEKWPDGIVYVATTHDGPRLFIARNDTERNCVSL